MRETEKEDILESIKKRKRNKLIISFSIIALIVIIFLVLSVLAYKYFQSPEYELELGADIEEFLISGDDNYGYVRLRAGSNDENKSITKVKLIFSDVNGNEYVYETEKGLGNISVPYKKGILDFFKGPEFRGGYNYNVSVDDVSGLESFENVKKVEVVFEYEKEDGEKQETEVLDTKKPTAPKKGSGGSGGGGGGGGGGGDGGDNGACVPSKTCADYSGCGTGLSDGCSDSLDCSGNCGNGFACVNESCVELVSCMNDSDCSYLSSVCGTGLCNLTTDNCEVDYNVSTTVCREGSNECDADEMCTGMSGSCPVDVNESDGTECTGGTCQSGKCIGVCSENWQCTSWSSCLGGQQTRTCIDANSCGTEDNKPAEQQSCVSGNFSEFKFAAYGDSRTGTSIHSDIVDMIVQDNVSFVLHTGDFVGTGGNWNEWQSQFLNIAQPLLDHEPSPGLTTFFYPSIGNHETTGTGWDTNYFNVFNISPVNQYYYSFDYQNAHFISLYVTNTWSPGDFNSGSAQYQWLLNDLAQASSNPNIKWKFVFFHAPVFSCIASHSCGRYIQEYLVPLFDQHGVTVVFGGDDHSYQRIGPIKDYLIDPVGTTYIITAGGGAPLYSFYGTTDCNLHEGRSDMPCDPSWTGMPHQAFPLEEGESVNHYMRFTVRDNIVVGEAIRRDGTIIETFNMQNDIEVVQPFCGNNTREGGEVCDGTDLNGQNCQSRGFDSGNLFCLSDCLGFDTSQCVACGNGNLETGEECDDGNNYDGDGCSSVCTLDSCVADIVGNICTGSEYCPASYVPSADSNRCCLDTCQEISGNVIYVDNLIANCNNYNFTERSCGNGNDISYNTLDEGSAEAQPGDTVLAREGIYNNWFRVQSSGIIGNPITIKNYLGETPTISLGGSGVGILIENKDYLIIEGFNISNVWAWGQVIDSSNIVFRNNKFYDATDRGSRGSLRFVNSDYNKVIIDL